MRDRWEHVSIRQGALIWRQWRALIAGLVIGFVLTTGGLIGIGGFRPDVASIEVGR